MVARRISACHSFHAKRCPMVGGELAAAPFNFMAGAPRPSTFRFDNHPRQFVSLRRGTSGYNHYWLFPR